MWAVRARLTLQYAALFLLAGAVLLTITLTLVYQSLQELPLSKAMVPIPEATAGAGNLPAPGVLPRTPPHSTASAEPANEPATGVTGGITPPPPATSAGPAAQSLRSSDFALIRLGQEELHDATIKALVNRGAIALGVVAVLGTSIGWVLAGRTLRPLEAAYDSQRRFVANASHELKTPIAISRGLLEMALRRSDPAPEVRRLNEDLLEVNHRQERLIDGLLFLASSEQAVLRRVSLDLAQIAETVLEDTPTQGITVQAALSPMPMHGDPVLLERMVRNLVENAIKYNVPGGSVRVTSARHRLTVTNTGPVVDPAELPALFEPFQRLHLGPDSPEGNGLGLSIVRSVARAHKGEVTAAPNPGGGLTVCVAMDA